MLSIVLRRKKICGIYLRKMEANMRSFIIFLGLIFILSLSQQAGAVDFSYSSSELPKEIAQLDVPSQYAYSFVVGHCEDWSMAFSELTRNGLSTSLQTLQSTANEEIKNRLARGGKGLQLEVLLDSLGYYQGLNTCFGQDQSRKDLFTISLIAGDLLGTSSAGALMVLSVAGPGKLLKTLQKIGVFPKLSLKTAKYLSIGFWTATIGTSGGLILMQIDEARKKNQEFLKQKQIDIEKARERLNETRTYLMQVKAMAAGDDLSPSEIERARVLIKKLTDLEQEYQSRIDRIN
jgi:hypothetical protein